MLQEQAQWEQEEVQKKRQQKQPAKKDKRKEMRTVEGDVYHKVPCEGGWR